MATGMKPRCGGSSLGAVSFAPPPVAASFRMWLSLSQDV